MKRGKCNVFIIISVYKTGHEQLKNLCTTKTFGVLKLVSCDFITDTYLSLTYKLQRKAFFRNIDWTTFVKRTAGTCFIIFSVSNCLQSMLWLLFIQVAYPNEKSSKIEKYFFFSIKLTVKVCSSIRDIWSHRRRSSNSVCRRMSLEAWATEGGPNPLDFMIWYIPIHFS